MKLTSNIKLYRPGNYPRIIGLFTDLSASTYYRIQVPLVALAEAGYPVAWGPLEAFEAITRGRPQSFDAALVSRTGTGDPKMVERAFHSEQRLGHVVLLDYDDDVLHIPEHNPGKHESTAGIETAMRIADGITITNTNLSRVVLEYNKNIAVVPNCIDRKQWPEPLYSPSIDGRGDGRVRVGLFGSPTHVKDWEITRGPLHRIKAAYGDRVEIVCGGHTPDYLKDIAVSLEPRPLFQYQDMLKGLDIGLAPLIDDTFNRSKSPIKAMEYGLAGAAVIGSPLQYEPLIRNNRGIVAVTENDWEVALIWYIENMTQRRGDAARLRKYLLEKMDVRHHTSLIAEQYARLYRTAKQSRKKKKAVRSAK